MQISRSSSIVATFEFLKVIFIKVVASAWKPGIDIMKTGMGQTMFWNHFGPKGIFMGMAGLPSGVTLALIFGLSSDNPKNVKKMPTSQPMAAAVLPRMNGG